MTRTSTRVTHGALRGATIVAEYRTWKPRAKSSHPGRTYVLFHCPYCGVLVKGYVWSLAGSGKRCECGVMHRTGRSERRVPA